MRQVDISILMPVFNAEKYVKLAIESIQAQTFKNWELIIVNDGSNDSSGQVCDDVAKDDRRIKVIHKKNTGISDTRNILINNSKGEYINFIDSDDYIEENMLEILINKIKAYNADISVCGIIEDKIVNNSLVSSKVNKYYPKDFFKIEEMKENIMEYGNTNLLNSLCNKLYKKEIIDNEDIRFDTNLENGEDLIFNLKYMKHINSLVFCEEQLYHYSRRQNDSITHKYVDDMYFKGLKIHDALESFFIEMNFYTEENKKSLCKNHLIGVFSAILNLFHPQCPMTWKERQKYIKKITNRDYVRYCAKERKRDKGIVGITAVLINFKSTILIASIFKLIAVIRKFKCV